MNAVVAQPLDVILRDGTTLRLRSPFPDDADALLEFFGGLSQQSLRSRYHGLPAVDVHLVEPMLRADGREAAVRIGFVEDRIVAVANFARLRDPKAAEVAFAVADEYQSRRLARSRRGPCPPRRLRDPRRRAARGGLAGRSRSCGRRARFPGRGQDRARGRTRPRRAASSSTSRPRRRSAKPPRADRGCRPRAADAQRQRGAPRRAREAGQTRSPKTW